MSLKQSKKRSYSRGGCNECRRRRIKCDESKPYCINCTRLSKSCVYQFPQFRFQHQPNPKQPAREPSTSPAPPRPFRNHISEILASGDPPVSPISILFDNASLLVNDMNSWLELETTGETTSAMSGSLDPLLKGTASPAPPVQSIEDYFPETPTATLLAQVIAKNSFTGPHEQYLTAISSTELSYHLFPFAESVESNQVVNILLRYSIDCPYLLSSMMAISAAFLYNQSGDTQHDASSQAYVTSSVRALGEAFNQRSWQVESSAVLMNNIERLLLTILLLASTFTAARRGSKELAQRPGWKSHLRGARELLAKYNEVVEKPEHSGGLALAKTWFFALECLSRLSGSSHKSAEELYTSTGYFTRDSNERYHDLLVNIGLLTPATEMQPVEFNLYCGYSVNYVKLSEEFVLSESGNKTHDGKPSPTQGGATKETGNMTHGIATVMASLHSARQTQYAPGVDPMTYLIPVHSPAHPDYLGANKITMSRAAHTTYQGNTYSWYDLCEQIRIDSLYLRVLTSPRLFNLPTNHHLVQELVQKILIGSFYLRKRADTEDADLVEVSESYCLPTKLFDTRAIMVQGAYRVCSRLILRENPEQYEQVELIFRGLVKLGNGSAQVALESVRRAWMGEKPEEDWIIPFA